MSWWNRRSDRESREPDTLRSGPWLALIVVEGVDRGARLGIVCPEVEIGRGDETSARDERVRLRDRSVSSRQARLRLESEGWSLEHLATASNPTLVNGEAVQRRSVAAGDRIRMGRVTLEVQSLTETDPAAKRGEERTEIIRVDEAAAQTTVIRAPSGVWGHIVVLQGPGRLKGARFPLQGDSVRLGRQPDCDIVLLDQGISRIHAEVARDGARVLLRNKSQTNPTLRNGVVVAAEIAIGHGDEIWLADAVRLRVELPGLSGDATTLPTGGLRRVMEARVDLEAQLEREFVRDGSFLDVDIADSYGLKASESRPERVFVSFERFRGYVADRVAEHTGRILNSNGDEVMAFFTSADSALRSARSLLTGLSGWNARDNLLASEFRVRIGIHTGRSAVDLASGVAYSPVLDVAGHLQKNAPINGVLISEATYSALLDDRAGLEPGKELPRESLKTWVLQPERIA
ncbi:MAG TPA: FHA domain-containing protein [Myxococcota bacterium]|nr:FHA domain-containing protein [Myxococcota bacterium]